MIKIKGFRLNVVKPTVVKPDVIKPNTIEPTRIEPNKVDYVKVNDDDFEKIKKALDNLNMELLAQNQKMIDMMNHI